MALDSKLVQNINLRANGDQLLKPLEAFGREINKVIGQLNKMSGTMSSGSHKQEDALRKQVQLLQRLVGEAATLQNILSSSKNRSRDGLFAGLEEQALGKKALSASKLKQTLTQTSSAAEALELRLAGLYKRFNALADAGRRVGKNDLNKAFNTQEAVNQVRKLEREIARLDSRAAARGGLSTDGTKLRADLQNKQDTLLNRIKNNRRVDWTKEIAELNLAAEGYRRLTRAEEESATAAQRAAAKRRGAIMETVNMNEAQMRASVNRGASRFSFTPDQARQFNMPQLNAQIEQGTQGLLRYQAAMSKAVAQGRSQAVIDRLAQGFDNLKQKISEATAQKRAFDALPEQRMKNLTSALFADGGMAFGARIAGAAVLTTGIFAALNAIRGSAQYVVQLEDAFARLQAISGATDVEMKQLGGTIVDLGTQTRYSTLEIAEAATQIVQAGYSASEAGDVLKASLMLASGSGSTVAEGVDTMTSSLGAFQLQASEAGRVSDILMEGLNRSKLSITQMQAALQYAGATAHETGMTLEELVAIAGSLANAGIRNGSTIGTGMRQLIVDMQTPSEKFQKELKSLGLTMQDVDVRAHSLAEVVKKLTAAGFSAESAYESFEVRAASAFLAFRNQLDTYDEMSVALTQSGAAARANAEAMDSLGAKWTQTKNTLGELLTMLSGPFVNALKATLDIINSVVGGVTDFVSGMGELLGMGGAVGGMLTGTLLPALAGFMIGGPLGAAIGGVLGFIGALKDASSASEELAAATNTSTQELAASRQTVTSVDEAIDRLVQRGESLSKNHVALQVEVLNLTGKFEGLASQLDTTKMSYEDLMEAMVRYRGLKLAEEGEKAREVVMNSVNEGRPVVQSLRGNTNTLRTQINNMNKTGPFAGKLNGAQSYINTDRDYTNMSGQGLLAETVKVRALINDLRQLGEGNHYIDAIIKNLQARLEKIQKVGELRGNITQAQMTQGLVAEINSPGGQQRDSFLLNARQKITEGLNANKGKQGTGDQTLATITNQAQVQLNNMKAELSRAQPASAKAVALQQSITDLQAEVARVTRASDRASEDLMDDERAGAGENLTGGAVAALIKKEFKGANVYSYNKRPYSEQVRLYNLYKQGKGALAAKPGRSRHGSGSALDMTPIAGMNIDQVAAFLESRGLELTEVLNEKHPETGRFHWHFAWKPKTSKYAKAQDSAKDKAAKELEQHLEAEAGYKADGAEKRLAAIIAEGKAGNRPVADLRKEFDTAALDYANASLNEFDVKNPTAGLSATALKTREMAKAALKAKLEEDVRKYFADFYRAVGDNAIDVMDRALKDSGRILEEALREADRIAQDAQRQIDISQNRVNRHNTGAGDEYILGRRKEAADDKSDRMKILGQREEIFRNSIAVSAAEAEANAMPAGEAKDAALERVAAAWAKIREQLEAVNILQQQVNDKQAVLVQMPIKERLEGAAKAWLENSGAMDSWQKQVQNAVGPALDTVTQGFSDFFMAIMDGSKSFKQALGDMLKSFATFVMQYIAKALALMAVKAILQAMGVTLPTGMFGGGQTGPNNANDDVPGMWNGGSVQRGVSNRDSALYNLAHGEYVVRNKSVREIGAANMDMINKHGKKGLDKIAGKGAAAIQNISMPKQETNVYVVQEKGQPPMGPGDILVTVHEDILQGGATKKLIKQVAQGG